MTLTWNKLRKVGDTWEALLDGMIVARGASPKEASDNAESTAQATKRSRATK